MPEEHNEIVATVAAAKAHERAAGPEKRGGLKRWPLQVGLGVGIGSAALAAAVLYANRERRGD